MSKQCRLSRRHCTNSSSRYNFATMGRIRARVLSRIKNDLDVYAGQYKDWHTHDYTRKMLTPTFKFKNYSKAVSSLLTYDYTKNYEPFVKEYVEILSDAIEHMEDGQTSRYRNIMEDIDMEQYHKIPNNIIHQTLHGYIDPNVKLTNEEWFRLLRSLILNYRIIVHVFEHCELNDVYPDQDMHSGNARPLSTNVLRGTICLHEEYLDILPNDIDVSQWPCMQFKLIGDSFLEIKSSNDEPGTDYLSNDESDKDYSLCEE